VFRSALLLVGLSSLHVAPITAQVVPVRSQDYLFVTNVADARALWVNPAGLVIIPEASLLGELTFERTGGDLRVEQWGFGFNSRGIAFGYQRNRLIGEEAVGTLRAGLGFPFQGGAIGATVSRYNQDSTRSYGVGVGVVYFPRLKVPVQLGATVRHIGRPTVREQELPVTGVAGVQLSTSTFQLSWETHAAERRAPNESGFDVRQRAGGRLTFGGRLPVILIATVDLGSNVRIDQLNVGFSIGAARQLTTIGSAVERDDNPVFERFSATVVATNPLTAAR
jgi:hypothetical protein